MAVEQITAEQSAKANETKATSDAGLAQKVAFDADDAARKVLEAADIAKQAAAKVPDALIVGLQTSIESMLKLINGYQSTKSPTFDPSPLIATTIASLNSVIAQLKAMQAPSIPGLTTVNALLAQLAIAAKSLDTAKQANAGTVPGENPEVSPEILGIVQDLLVATQSLCTMIPLAILKVVFDMFVNVILCFVQIMPRNDGFPIIPPLLLTAPLCSAGIVPLMSFVNTFNERVGNATHGVFRKAAKQVQDAQVPLAALDIVEPSLMPAVPGRS